MHTTLTQKMDISDSRAYVCCTSVCILTVPDPLVTANDISVAVGDVAILTCKVSGTPLVSVIKFQWQWAEDMSVIQGGNSTKYQVFSSLASMSDNGVYTGEVTVHDEGNSPLVIPACVSMNITLTVTSKRWYSFPSYMYSSLPCMLHVACNLGCVLTLCPE